MKGKRQAESFSLDAPELGISFSAGDRGSKRDLLRGDGDRALGREQQPLLYIFVQNTIGTQRKKGAVVGSCRGETKCLGNKK